jgi:hypothetical protein
MDRIQQELSSCPSLINHPSCSETIAPQKPIQPFSDQDTASIEKTKKQSTKQCTESEINEFKQF